MNKKNWLKKAGAFLLTICMVAGALQFTPHVSKASATATDVNAELQAAGYTRVTPETFGLQYRKYENTTSAAVGNYAEELSTSLDMTYLDVDVAFSNQYSSDNSIRYAGFGGPGISISGCLSQSYPGNTNIYVKDASDNSDATSHLTAVTGITDLEQTFNLKFAVKYGTASGTETPITYNMWINNVQVATNKVVNVKSVASAMSIIVAPNAWIEIKAPAYEAPETPAEDVNAQLQEAGYTRVTPEDFGLEDGLYDSTTMSSGVAYGYEYGKSLDMTYLDVDISMNSTTSNTALRFAGNGDTGILLSGYYSSSRGTDFIYITDSDREATDGTEYSMSESGITTISTTYNLKFAVKYGTASGSQTQVTYNMWINDVKVVTDKVINVNNVGQRLAVHVASGNSITIATPAYEAPETPVEEVNAQLQAAGYTRVTPLDLGFADGTYENNTNELKQTTGPNYSTSLDMTYLDVDIAFKNQYNSNNCIRFAGDAGIHITGCLSQSFGGDTNLYIKDGWNNSPASHLSAETGITDLEQTFNLKFAVKYGTPSGGLTPVTYNMWINNVKVATDKIVNVKALGQNMAIIVAPDAWVRISSPQEPAKEIEMQEVADISEYRASSAELNTAPTKAGYVFAGWYDEDGNPIAASTTSGKAYAKFVDEDVMSVKAQITANTTAESNQADIRFVSTVDSLDYTEVGFIITPQGCEEQVKSTTRVYEKLYYAGKDNTTVDETYKPTEMSEHSTYFYAYSYWGILNEHFDYTFDVTPYWKTLDGTTVYGATVQKSVSMGIAN